LLRKILFFLVFFTIVFSVNALWGVDPGTIIINRGGGDANISNVNLSDLNNVDANAPDFNYFLQWTGNYWVPGVCTGGGTGSFVDTNVWTEGFSLTDQNQLLPDTNCSENSSCHLTGTGSLSDLEVADVNFSAKITSTTEAKTWYVSNMWGSDATGDGTATNPYQTIDAAWDAMPQVIRHTQIIDVNDDNDNDGHHAIYEETFGGSKAIIGGQIKVQSSNYQARTNASGGGNNYLDRATASWDVNQFVDCRVYLLDGDGNSQYRDIWYNTATRIYTKTNWSGAPMKNPANGTKFMVICTQIRGDTGEDESHSKAMGFNTSKTAGGLIGLWGFRWAYFTQNAIYVDSTAQVQVMNNAFDHIDTGEDELGVVRVNQFMNAAVYNFFMHDNYQAAQSKVRYDSAGVNAQFNTFVYLSRGVINNTYEGIHFNGGTAGQILDTVLSDPTDKCDDYGVVVEGVSGLKHKGAGTYPQGNTADSSTANGGVFYS